MNTERQQAIVLGLGDTGMSVVRYLTQAGYSVCVTDTRDYPPHIGMLRKDYPGIGFSSGAFNASQLAGYDLVVSSPGISLAEPALAEIIAAGHTVIGDIELFASAAKAPIIGITGSNGKSAVTQLIGDICQQSEVRAKIGGNIGKPALSLLEEDKPDVYVLELSSFQLETTYSLNAYISVLLNLSEDHMDRYASFEEYVAAKKRIFNGNGIVMLNADDPNVKPMAMPGRKIIYFSINAPLNASSYGVIDHKGEAFIVHGDKSIMPVSAIKLTGSHNVLNTVAAVAVADQLRIPVQQIIKGVSQFCGLEHRCEVVAKKSDVVWVNDSKGTNVGATISAIEGIKGNIILIAGGEGKGADFSALHEAVTKYVKAVLLIGRDAPLIEKALQGATQITMAGDMKTAVQKAGEIAVAGDVVLLSPACASFDMYQNYMARGKDFKQQVAKVVGHD